MVATQASLIYEQCLWDRDHVEAIYRNLAGIVVDDGSWHEIPLVPSGAAYYRVLDGRYFQFLDGDPQTGLFQTMLSVAPMEVGHDAEWTIAEIADGYSITTHFATMPGPAPVHSETDRWLERHGLGLDPADSWVQGYAYFEALDTGCLTDAVRRLDWLEHAMEDVNLAYEALSERFWGELKAESDAVADTYRGPEDEVVPLPPRYYRPGAWKSRMPLPPKGPDASPGARPPMPPSE